VSADVKSAKAKAIQTLKLERVHTDIERQVQAVDEALRLLEDDFLLDLGAQPQDELSLKWARTREQRDQSLAVQDQVSFVPLVLHGNKPIKDMVDALARLKTQHSEMQQMEQQMAAAMPGRDWAALVGQLHKLRQQRLHQLRILYSHGVSSRTGYGLSTLRRALAGLMEDTRQFAHVGVKVPLNYSMLERLAQEGREEWNQPSTPLLYRGHVNGAKLDANNRTISFKRGRPVTIRSRQRCPVGRKAYYELKILAEVEEYKSSQYGFASVAFTSQLGPSREEVGNDAVSWAVNGARQVKWNKGEQEAYACEWKQGNVIGLACDLQEMQMLVSVNGSFAPPNGFVFDLAPDAVFSGILAAFSDEHGTVGYNLGEAPFKYDPPAADYCAFVEMALNHVRVSVLFSTHTCLLKRCLCELTHAGSTLYLIECPCMVFVNADEHRPSSCRWIHRG